MRLLLTNRSLNNRDCSRCLKYLYNEQTGLEEEAFPGQPYKRFSDCPPPCRTKEGCKKGTPEEPNTLTSENLQAFIHYRKCKAVSIFPDDPIVATNAAIISLILEEVSYE